MRLGSMLYGQGNVGQAFGCFNAAGNIFMARNTMLFAPLWQGEETSCLGVVYDGAMSDCIYCMQWLSWAKQRAKRLYVLADEKLHGTLQAHPLVDVVLPIGYQSNVSHICHMFALPSLYQSDVHTMARTSYLTLSLDRVNQWQQRFIECSGLKVGVALDNSQRNRESADVFALNKNQNKFGSYDYDWLFSTLDEASFFLFEYPFTSIAKQEEQDCNFMDCRHFINNLEDAAEFIQNLDLIISTDGVFAHLCGGLGKPVWVLQHWVAQ